MKNQLQELRRKADITQDKAAEIFGVSRSTYQKYERDAIQPSYKVLKLMADYFGVTTDYLLGKDEEDVQPPDDIMQCVSERDRDTIMKYLSLPEDLRRTISDLIVSISEHLNPESH